MSSLEEKNMEIAGINVNTVVAPRPLIVDKKHSKIVIIFKSITSLLKGMLLTIKYFLRPSTIVTQQYPENRDTLKIPERTRGRLIMMHNEEGIHNCTACMTCDIMCPNKSITVTKEKSPVTGKPVLGQFIWRQDTCTFCNICVIVCPFDTITMVNDFESSVYDRRLLVYNLNEYAGPAKVIMKKLNDDEISKSMIPYPKFGGELPLNGVALDAVEALNIPKKPDPVTIANEKKAKEEAEKIANTPKDEKVAESAKEKETKEAENA